MYTTIINPFGVVAVGEATERKNAGGIRIAAIGTAVLATHFQNGESYSFVIAKHNKRKDEVDPGVRMACALQIVPQWIVVIAGDVSRQEAWKR